MDVTDHLIHTIGTPFRTTPGMSYERAFVNFSFERSEKLPFVKDGPVRHRQPVQVLKAAQGIFAYFAIVLVPQIGDFSRVPASIQGIAQLHQRTFPFAQANHVHNAFAQSLFRFQGGMHAAHHYQALRTDHAQHVQDFVNIGGHGGNRQKIRIKCLERF